MIEKIILFSLWQEDDITKMLAATTHIGSENSEITMEPYVFKKRVWENFCSVDAGTERYILNWRFIG